MPKISLKSGEVITDGDFKKYGTVPVFLFKVLIPAGIIISLFLVLKYALPALATIGTYGATKDIKVYRVMHYAYIPLMILFLAACIYYFASLFIEKIVITNKAIIQKGVFSNHRIALADIRDIALTKGTFNSINEQKQQAWLITNMLGINKRVEIKGKDNTVITVTNLTRANALRLIEMTNKASTNTPEIE